ncbi:hypothetical protein ACEUZ9_005418 [Paracoccus litorisediminis]|uniref:hypothetical protein n=1 Tax=Paracoccus litorisediminis TaxID=2006130 RepID=UPI001FE9B783|nr:hypothetical protein [Paracoccus litorisediminis]
MTEFDRSPHLTGVQLQELGYRMLIWPGSLLRVANKAQAWLYTTLRDHDSTDAAVPKMQTRAELYYNIGYFDFKALVANIRRSSAARGRLAARIYTRFLRHPRSSTWRLNAPLPDLCAMT